MAPNFRNPAKDSATVIRQFHDLAKEPATEATIAIMKETKPGAPTRYPPTTHNPRSILSSES